MFVRVVAHLVHPREQWDVLESQHGLLGALGAVHATLKARVHGLAKVLDSTPC